MDGLNFLLSNYSILENPTKLKAYMDPKDEDGNSDEVTKQNNHRSLALLIRDLIDNFSNNELKLLLERMEVSKYDKYTIYGGKAKETQEYLSEIGERSKYNMHVTSSEFFYLDEVDVLTYCFKKDNLEAYELFLEDGVLHTQFDGSRLVPRDEMGTTVYTEIVEEIFYRVSGYHGESNNNLELLEQFILLPLYYDKSENFKESIHTGEPSVNNLIFLRKILVKQHGGVFIPEELEALDIIEDMLKRSIETVERHNLMNAKQRLNTVKGLEDDGSENPSNVYLDEDTRNILKKYTTKAIPYSQAEPFFDPDETLEQHLEKKDEVKGKNLTKKKKRKKKGKKQKKGKWGSAAKKGGAHKDLSPEDYANWKNIHALSNDCVPCVLDLLGFNEEETKILAGFYGKRGMSDEEIIDEFKRIYPDHGFAFLHSKNLFEELKNIREKILLVERNKKSYAGIVQKSKSTDDLRFYIKRYANFIKEFYDDIFSDNENTAVLGRYIYIGNIRDNNIRSHVVSLSKYNGEYILYDAQNKKISIGLRNVTLFLISQRAFRLDYLWGFKVDPEVSTLNLNKNESSNSNESQRENDELLNELDGLVSKLDNSMIHNDSNSIRESRLSKIMDNPNTV